MVSHVFQFSDQECETANKEEALYNIQYIMYTIVYHNTSYNVHTIYIVQGWVKKHKAWSKFQFFSDNSIAYMKDS